MERAGFEPAKLHKSHARLNLIESNLTESRVLSDKPQYNEARSYSPRVWPLHYLLHIKVVFVADYQPRLSRPIGVEQAPCPYRTK